MLRQLSCLLLLFPLALSARADWLHFKNGHLKAQYQTASYPDDSLLRELIGTPANDLNSDLRLMVGGNENRFSWQADYQLVARSGDSLELSRLLQGSFLFPGGDLNDDRRVVGRLAWQNFGLEQDHLRPFFDAWTEAETFTPQAGGVDLQAGAGSGFG